MAEKKARLLSVGLKLGQGLRRWPSIKSKLIQLVLADRLHWHIVMSLILTHRSSNLAHCFCWATMCKWSYETETVDIRWSSWYTVVQAVQRLRGTENIAKSRHAVCLLATGFWPRKYVRRLHYHNVKLWSLPSPLVVWVWSILIICYSLHTRAREEQ